MADESQGNPAPNAGQGSGAPQAPPEGAKPFGFGTEEEFNAHINRAIGNRLKDFEKKVDGKFGEIQTGLTGFSAKFDEFGKSIAGLKPKEAEPKLKDGPQSSPVKLEDFPEWKAQQGEIEQLKKKASAAELAAAQELAKNRATSLRTKLAEKLASVAGIPADRQRPALALLIAEEARVSYSDGGKGDTIVWRGDEGEVPLEDGLRAWAKTSDAKALQPPINPKGSGSGAGRAGGAGPPNTSADSILEQLLTEQIRG